MKTRTFVILLVAIALHIFLMLNSEDYAEMWDAIFGWFRGRQQN